MGTWDVGSFDNDAASDWVSELAEADASLVSDAFTILLQNDGYLEAPDCARAVAAAEVVAAMRKRPAESLPEEVAAFVGRMGQAPSPDLVTAARAALERIRTASELQELWEMSDFNEAWRKSIADLESRLG